MKDKCPLAITGAQAFQRAVKKSNLQNRESNPKKPVDEEPKLKTTAGTQPTPHGPS
jgi:hypothetical protein